MFRFEYYNIISFYSSHRLIFLKDKDCVFFEVQPEFLYIADNFYS